MRAAIVTAMGLTAGLVFSAPVLANGGDFFEELSASWGTMDANAGLPFFGLVRDARGKGIPGAAVSASTQMGSTFFVTADSRGHYRIPGFKRDIDPKTITINCAKSGYKLVSKDRRVMRNNPNAPIEVNCFMAPDASAKAAS